MAVLAAAAAAAAAARRDDSAKPGDTPSPPHEIRRRAPRAMFSDLGGSASAGEAAGAAAGLEPPPRMACALCRRRKLRCNRQLPCDSCTRLGFDCLYSEQSRTPPATRRPRTLPPDGRTGTLSPLHVTDRDDDTTMF